jgi:hypothetical protein
MPNLKTISKILISLFLLLGLNQMKAQDSTKTRYLLSIPPIKSFTENPVNFTHGLSFGLWNLPHSKQTINGINFELIGYGWMTPFLGLDDGGSMNDNLQKINGISFGVTLLSKKVNGLAISPIIATTNITNGIQASLFNFSLMQANGIQIGLTNYGNQNNGLTIGVFNWTYQSNGVQIGLVNKSKDLKGFQFGIININQKRTLPFINWAFKK